MGYPPGANRSAYDIGGVDRNFEDRSIKPEIWEDERIRFRRTQQIDDYESSEKRYIKSCPYKPRSLLSLRI